MGGNLKEGSVKAARDAWGSVRAASRVVPRLNKRPAASGPSLLCGSAVQVRVCLIMAVRCYAG